jgi:hypothetical protein
MTNEASLKALREASALVHGEEPVALTPMESYLKAKSTYRPVYIQLYYTGGIEKLRAEQERQEQERRIEEMDPWDYALELDCAALCEFDRLLPKEDDHV